MHPWSRWKSAFVFSSVFKYSVFVIFHYFCFGFFCFWVLNTWWCTRFYSLSDIGCCKSCCIRSCISSWRSAMGIMMMKLIKIVMMMMMVIMMVIMVTMMMKIMTMMMDWPSHECTRNSPGSQSHCLPLHTHHSRPPSFPRLKHQNLILWGFEEKALIQFLIII